MSKPAKEPTTTNEEKLPYTRRSLPRLSKISPLRLPGKMKNLALKPRNGSKGVGSDEKPLALLRVQVVSGTNLLGKDKGGTSSDPFVTISLPPTRLSTPVIKKSLDPIFPEKESTFDLPIFASQAGRIGSLEAVVWDKDLLRKEFLGEVSVKIQDWFVGAKALEWHPDAKPIDAVLVSSRRKSRVSGSIQLRIGFVPPPLSEEHTHAALAIDFESLYDDLVRRSNERGILTVAPYEGIGTVLSGDVDLEDDGLSDSSDTEDEFEVGTSALPSPALHPSSTSSLMTPSSSTAASSSTNLTVPKASLPSSKEKKNGKGPGYFDVPPSASPAVTPSGGKTPKVAKVPKIKKSSNGKNGKDWSYSHSKDILGIVMIEIKSAEDLPRLKNMLKTGFDMDPFVVTSFGKKVFRTRVVRHSLNPTWEEKLLFHVRQYETNFTIQFDILDWDKISGNDHIGTATIPLAELIANAPKPDPETGLHASDGKHEMKEFKLLLSTPDSKWDMHKPSITLRAKYEPYDALRQKFWREYILTYDADSTGQISLTELQAMLDSLGSTLTQETVEGYFIQNNVDPREGELSVEQVVQCLEIEVKKSSEEKKDIGPAEEHPLAPSGTSTPSLLSGGLPSLDPLDAHGHPAASVPLDVTGPSAPPSQGEAAIDPTRAASLGNGPGLEEVEQTRIIEEEDSDDEEDEDVKDDDKERVINIKTCPLCHRQRLSKRAEVDIVTHLAVCASADWGRVNRLVVGNFVTSSQAQRKWVSKIISKVSSGAYQLGANSANIIVQDRVSGQLQEEKMASYVRFGIRVLYKGARSRMEGGRARKLLKSLSVKQGLKYDSEESAAEIPAFIAFHRLNVDEILDPLESFKTFNQFFYRKLKPSARPIDQDPDALVSVADCRLMCFDTVSDAQKLWIKGREFTIERLLGEKFGKEASKFSGGSVGIFRLAPQDYHRFHFPVDGVVTGIEKIEGAYYTVNPQAIRTQLDVYGENVRSIVKIDSPVFGTVFAVCVGAMMVGSIHHEMKVGDTVKKGDEMGYFAFGGSTIVLLLESEVLLWDPDLRQNAQATLETLVQMGTKLGTRKQTTQRLPPVPSRAVE